LSNNKLSTTH